ncbi:MAG: tyrosine-type recombinase/integrase, partial [Desulfobulbaceae bacterium]|nr:tyrosine-type recombinase/integrase [Desulfobulbaceae bacterium]
MAVFYLGIAPPPAGSATNPPTPAAFQTIRDSGMLKTQLAIRLLLLTGVRTGELRLATPDQFDLDRGLWIIPVMSLKQRKMLTRKKRKRPTDIPPYIVPLSVQAMEVVRYMLEDVNPAQKYLFAGVKRIIYLGGLGDPSAELSQHLRSRQLTG